MVAFHVLNKDIFASLRDVALPSWSRMRTTCGTALEQCSRQTWQMQLLSICHI